MGGSAQREKRIEDLSKDFEINLIDLPGFNANNHLPVINEIIGFSDWIISELRRRNIKKYHLLGHSMGGMIVQKILPNLLFYSVFQQF